MDAMDLYMLTPSEAYFRIQEIQERVAYRTASKEELNELRLLREIVDDEILEGAFIS